MPSTVAKSKPQEAATLQAYQIRQKKLKYVVLASPEYNV